MRDYLNIFKRWWVTPIRFNRYFFSSLWQLVRDMWRWPRRMWQRATRGYCTEDLFNLDQYLLSLLYATLMDFSKTNGSYPIDFNSLHDWNSTVRDIALRFYEADENNKVFVNPHQPPSTWDDNTSQQIKENWIAREREIVEQQKESFHRGIVKLEKYFWNLWD